jgi:TolB protein
MKRLCIHLAALFAAALALASAVQAEAPPVIEITPGKLRAFRAAIQRFDDQVSPPRPSRADDLRNALEDALRFSSVLVPLAHAAFLGEEDTKEFSEGHRYDCSDWVQSGADALVEGRIENDSSRVAVEFAVWDVARCTRLARKRLSRVPAEGPLLAKLVADAIVEAFTGIPGSAATEVAFISTRTGAKEVFVMNADGGHQRPATNNRAIKAFPTWFPSGQAILYTAYQDRQQPALFITSRGEARPGPILRRLLPDVPKYRGVFDPSGETLALVTSVDGAAEIFLVRRDGRKLQRLTHSPAIDISPVWSPDGKRICFVSDRSGSPQLYLVDRDGGNLRRLSYEGSYNTSPAWSPDGRWIAYQTRLEGQFDIWLIDPEGDVNVPLVQHPRSDESPTWSPDGRKIAFTSNRRGLYDVYLMDANGENEQRLTQGEGDNTGPTWGPFPR